MSKKYDVGKPRMDLLPPIAQEQVAEAFTYGANKYAPWNYLNEGLDTSRLFAATIRHLNEWNKGNDIDPESNVSHLGHAGANIAMLIETLKHYPNKDDRFKKLKLYEN